LGLDAGQIQLSEPTTEEYPEAEDSASDMGRVAARSYQKINRQSSASVCALASTQKANTLNINCKIV